MKYFLFSSYRQFGRNEAAAVSKRFKEK